MLNCNVLKCNVLKCNVLKCNVLKCNVLKCNVLNCNVLKCNVLNVSAPLRCCIEIAAGCVLSKVPNRDGRSFLRRVGNGA